MEKKKQQAPRTKAAPSPLATSMNQAWCSDVYFPSLVVEKAAALDQLHQATNWGLSIVGGILTAVLVGAQFPTINSLLIILATLVLTLHFMIRSLKGYINVTRWALLQRRIAAHELHPSAASVVEVEMLVDRYHLNWCLPIRQRDVGLKGLVELGFGYMFVFQIGLSAWCFNELPASLAMLLGSALVLLLCCIETLTFLRSPYLRTAGDANQDAVRYR